jgi:hypothetical protein
MVNQPGWLARFAGDRLGTTGPFRALAAGGMEEIAMCTRTLLLAGLVGLVVCLLSLDRAPSYLDLLVGLPGGETTALRAENHLDEKLSYRCEVTIQRIRVKRLVVLQVAAGELTLFEAAAWFQFINDTPPEYSYAWLTGPGASKEEKACWQVIGYLQFELRAMGSPDSATAVCDRLTKQLEAHLAEHGRVVLPEL